MHRSLAVAVLSAAVVLALGAPALANHTPPLELEVLIDGVSSGIYDEDILGCSSTGPNTFQCAGSSLPIGGQYGMSLDSWSLTLDSDPVVSGITAVTNLSSSAQQFTLIFTLPTVLGPSSLMGGGLQGGITDNNGNGATITAPTGSAFYTALIDGVTQQTLHADPYFFSVGNFVNGSFPSLNWGTPIPSAPGPAVTTNIRIQLDFLLSGNDSASMTSNFVVLPVPEPGTGLMLALGLGALALRRRRS